MILAVEGRLDEAAQVLALAAKKDPNDGRILLQMGRVLAAQGKLNDAVNYFREATRYCLMMPKLTRALVAVSWNLETNKRAPNI